MDSLRAAALLKQQGHEVIAVHMRILPGSSAQDPVTNKKESVVKELARRLGIPLRIVNLQESFEALVIQPFRHAYLEGLTPNPCVVCNRAVKFGILLEKARKWGAQKLATGHYARLIPPNGNNPRYRLLRGKDLNKDQSYFLYGLSQVQLAQIILPLGNTTKQESYKWAEENGFLSLIKEESQEICFIPHRNYREFMASSGPSQTTNNVGLIVDTEGNVLGTHKGIFNYTIGQRRGLGISSKVPYYVVALNPHTNTVIVGRSSDLFRSTFRVSTVNWVSIDKPSEPIRALVRIRNQHQPAPATLIPSHGDSVIVHFQTPQRAITPGQSAVFYQEDVVLGGGIIARD